MSNATLRIIGRRMPGLIAEEYRNVHLGVQRRREVVELIPGNAPSAVFDLPIDARPDPVHGIDYRGPFAQGRPGQRFIYLSWGDLSADGTFTMFRRAKLKLPSIPGSIAHALVEGGTVRAALDLVDAHGLPLCASIPPHSITWSIG